MHSHIEVKEYPISYEYIRGLTDGEGCFTFCSAPVIKNGFVSKQLVPTFVISMHVRDENLLCLVAKKLKLRNKVLVLRPSYSKSTFGIGKTARIMVRDIGQLKNIIIPLFYKKLVGHKRIQFEAWMERIGTDPMVAERYRFIYGMYKAGFYDKHPFVEG